VVKLGVDQLAQQAADPPLPERLGLAARLIAMTPGPTL